MRVALYCPDPDLARSVRGSLNGAEPKVFDSRDRFARMAARADILLVAAERLDKDVPDLVRSVRRDEPQRPFLLITSDAPDNAARLGRIEVDRVVWIGRIADTLPAVLRQYLDDLPRFRLVAALTTHTAMPGVNSSSASRRRSR